ncbi:hypothetical protein KVR01_012393 [Diaporthe batatas]|uniref:uncharacterized protein n=1 Tax=Diaporthe batatas TaxID=748121 RepID=UPI001D0473D9|nr:uncharacterized protein KVR01_012393 [Diaporthe batatas]KAG8157731.1 hypothetical protein KVR01_012393 [Diaporthe batatas]
MGTETDNDHDPEVMVRRSKSDLRLLNTGEFSDFTVICGDRQWKAHKAILTKVPYFHAIFSGGFKVSTHPASLGNRFDQCSDKSTTPQESTQEKITIEGLFEPFEIQWLLAYIYFPHFDPFSARHDSPSASFIETIVRLWQLGDYFQVEGMTKQAERNMDVCCNELRANSQSMDRDSLSDPVTFPVDVECAIRRAWHEDLASGPLLREKLTNLCVDFAPYLKRQKSFSTLLEEVPGFAIAFAQRALGTLTTHPSLPMPPASPRTPEAQNVFDSEDFSD